MDTILADPARAAKVTSLAMDAANTREDQLAVVFADGEPPRLPGNYLVFVGGEMPSLPEGSNVLLVPAHAGTSEVLSAAQDACSAIGIINETAPHLLDALLSGAALDRLAAIAEEALGNPVAIMDDAGHALAFSPNGNTGDELWNRIVCHGEDFYSDEEALRFLGADVTDPEDHAGLMVRPFVIDSKPWKRRLIAGIWQGSSCRHSFAVLEDRRSLRRQDALVLTSLCEVASRMLDNGLAETPEGLGAIADALVSCKDTPSAELLAKARQVDALLAQGCRMVLLTPPTGSATYEDILRQLAHAQLALPHAITFAHGMHGALLAEEKDVRRMAEKGTGLKGVPAAWQVSTSCPIQSSKRLRAAYEQCRAVERLGGMSLAPGRIGRFEDVLELRAFEVAAERLEPLSHVDATAVLIRLHDEEHETEYARTILEYALRFRSMPAVARALSLHRNTVAYRLERAEQLFGVNLADDTTLNRLRASLQLLRVAG